MITILLQKILAALTQLLGDIKTKLNTIKANLDNLIVVATASGPIASFTTTITKPFISCNVEIKPKQASGTPTPSNPLPISGTDTVIVTQTDEDNQVITTKTVSLPETVYGGSLDLVSGVLTITHNLLTYTGEDLDVLVLNYGLADEGYTHLVFAKNGLEIIGTATADNSKSNMLPFNIGASGGSIPTAGECYRIINAGTPTQRPTIYWYIHQTWEDNQAFKDWLDLHPFVVSVPLATPVSIQLTPEEITAISGVNNVFGDTDGNTSVEYLKII